MMKKILHLFVVSIIALTVNLLQGAVGGVAEAAPTFGVSGTHAKVTDGWLRAPGGNALATDGSSFYVANTGFSSTSGEYIVKLTRSTDSGMTWGPPSQVATSEFGFTDVTSVSVSGSATAGQKIIHVVWEQMESENWDDPVGIYYSWADDANLNNPWGGAFSNPIRIDGTVDAAATWARTSLTTSPGGEIHIVFQGMDGKLYYTTASNNVDGEFSPPAALPGMPTEWGDIESALDNNGNLHVAYPTSDESLTMFGLEYTRKPAGTNTWTTPVVVEPLTEGNEGFTSIGVYNQNRIYIAKHDYKDVTVYRTRNGGDNWRKNTVFSGTAMMTPTRHLSLAVDTIDHDIIVACGFELVSSGGEWLEETMVFQSRNRGRSWSNGGVIPNVTSPSVKFDSSGNAGIVFKGANDLRGGIYFTKQQ